MPGRSARAYPGVRSGDESSHRFSSQASCALGRECLSASKPVWKKPKLLHEMKLHQPDSALGCRTIIDGHRESHPSNSEKLTALHASRNRRASITFKFRHQVVRILLPRQYPSQMESTRWIHKQACLVRRRARFTRGKNVKNKHENHGLRWCGRSGCHARGPLSGGGSSRRTQLRAQRRNRKRLRRTGVLIHDGPKCELFFRAGACLPL